MTSEPKTLGQFKLDFTGKMTIMVEIENDQVMSFHIDDKDVVLDVLRVLVNGDNGAVMDVREQDDTLNERFYADWRKP
jgi:hypothetical protein